MKAAAPDFPPALTTKPVVEFATIPVVKADGSTGMLGFEESAAIFDHLKSQGFVDAKGKVQDSLRSALKDGSFALPEALEAHLASVRDALKRVAGKLDIKNADERIVVKTRQAILESAEFQALWDRIKHKTTYRVHFDNEKLLVDCAKAIANGPPVSKARVRIRKADLSIGQGGVLVAQGRRFAGGGGVDLLQGGENFGFGRAVGVGENGAIGQQPACDQFHVVFLYWDGWLR